MSRVATVALGTCCQLCRGEGGWMAWEQVVMLEGQEETSTTMGTIGQKGWANSHSSQGGCKRQLE